MMKIRWISFLAYIILLQCEGYGQYFTSSSASSNTATTTTISTAPDLTQNVLYNHTFKVSNTFGTAPYSYAITSGKGKLNALGIFKAAKKPTLTVITTTDAKGLTQKTIVTTTYGIGGPAMGIAKVLTPGNYAAIVVTADFNNDGFNDIVYAAEVSTLGFYKGDGGSNFVSGAMPSPLDVPSSLTVGDFNGDNKLDIAIGYKTLTQVGIQLGNGDGTFNATISISNAPYTNGYVTTGDANNDGIDDIIVLVDGPATGELYSILGNTAGAFVNTSVIAYTPGFVMGVAVCDINNDGTLDAFVVGGSSSTDVSVHFGNNNGTFQIATTGNALVGTASAGTMTTCIDIDNDGNNDVVVGTTASYKNFAGLGTGSNAVSNFAINVGTAASYFGLAEFNNDSQLDFVGIGNLPAQIRIGNGTGAEQGSLTTSTIVNGVITTDFNNDGKADIVGFGNSTIEVFIAQ